MAKLSADKIGRNAVTCVERALRNCALLQSDIEKKGNTMSLDGQVNVFHSSLQDKDHFFGFVPVQVKGTYKEVPTYEKMLEFASVKDLEVYQKESGAIYFYVYMGEHESQIYYSMLLPYDLKRILKNSAGKKKIKIELERFPENDINEMTNIFMAFISNKHKQSEVIFDEIYTLEELEDRGVAIESVGFEFTGIGFDKRNFDKFLTTHSFYLYAKTKGIKKYIPIEKAANITLFQDVDAQISIGGITYYTKLTLNSRQGKRTIQFGASFEFDIPETPPATLEVHITGKLKQRITDIEFMIALNSIKKLSLNGVEFVFEEFNISDQELIMLKQTLAKLKIIKETLDELGVQCELDIDNISESDERKINVLVKAIKEKEPISLGASKVDKLVMGFFNVTNVSILFLGQLSQEFPEKYIIGSYMKPYQLKFKYEENGQLIERFGSQYLVLESEHYLKASNLNYEVIFESLTSFGNDDALVDRIVCAMLEVIKAYDKNLKDELLCLAEKICEWVINNRNYEESKSKIDILNKLQLIKRRRELNPNELAELLVIRRTCDQDDILCAVNILLNEAETAKTFFNKLPLDIRKTFIEYPICNLWDIRDEMRGELNLS